MGNNLEYRRAAKNISENKGFMCPMCSSFIQPGFDCCPVCGETPDADGNSEMTNESFVMFLMFFLVFIAPFTSFIAGAIGSIGAKFLTIPSLLIVCIMGLIGIVNIKYVIKQCQKKKNGLFKTAWKLKWSVWVLAWVILSVFHLFGFFLY